MTSAQEWTEEERTEKIAEALTALGLDASTEDTGGGIVCIVIPRTNGGAISRGIADLTWGAAITDENGEWVSHISTECPSNSMMLTVRRKPSLTLRFVTEQCGTAVRGSYKL
jgi:hypothetical protein